MVKVPKGYRSKNVRDLRGSSGGGRRGGFRLPSGRKTRGGGGLGGNMGGGGLGDALGGAGAGAALGKRKGGGCGGIGLIVLLVVLALLFFSCVGGGSPTSTGGTSSTGGSSADGATTANTSPATSDEIGLTEDLVNFVLDDVQEFWIDEFAAIGQTYPEAQLTLFDNNVSTGGCGNASSAVGPFYCPADSNAYIDLVYMVRLQRQLGAEGDFSQAYILAHEIGHHVQNALGTNDAVRRAQSGASRTESNQLQVMMELQADCFAGAWARDANDRGDIIETGDLQEGVRAAGAVGDDAITGSSNQENFTHGSSAQRVEWFERGFDSGSNSCDTFNGALG
jgi:predicted metalloprotease